MKRKQPKQAKPRKHRIKALFCKIRTWIVSKRPKQDPITAREVFVLPGEWSFAAPDEIERKELLRRITALSIALLAMLGAWFGAQNIYRESKEQFPNAIALRSDYGMNFDFEEKVQDKACRVSLSQGTIYTDQSMQYNTVNICYTDENLPNFIDLHMVAGTYFKIMDYTQQNKNIVISEEVAVAQFKTHRAVGYKLLLNGEEYTVCGVYRPHDSLLSNISSNGYPDVYLPFMAVEDVNTLPVQLIYVDTSITGYTNAVVGALANKTGITIWPQHITSYPDLLDLMVFFKKLLIFMIGAALIVVCAKWMWHFTVPSYQWFTADENQRKGYPYLVRAVFWLLAGVGIFLLVRFELAIPQSVLPNDNIFDFSYYAGEVLTALQSHNQITLYDFHWNYCFNALAAYSGWMLLTAVLFWVVFVKAVQLVRYIRETLG